MSMTEPKYPHIEVELVGQNGNVFNLIGLVLQALRRAKISQTEQTLFQNEVMSSESYDEALQCIMRWVCVS